MKFPAQTGISDFTKLSFTPFVNINYTYFHEKPSYSHCYLRPGFRLCS